MQKQKKIKIYKLKMLAPSNKIKTIKMSVNNQSANQSKKVRKFRKAMKKILISLVTLKLE